MENMEEQIPSSAPLPSTWQPEMFGFEPEDLSRTVFRYKNYELRSSPNDMWLLRRLRKINMSKSEMLVKWYMKIESNDFVYAMLLLTKGLR